ncbi:Glucose-6-phosphate 1-dehydrogenase [Dirofilaria immitis]|nr:Glucose-6-phosphate 1-dehydrogenase [Dirofilaria immitis]
MSNENSPTLDRNNSLSAPLSMELVNFLKESMGSINTDPYVFVIFGASGDLARKKIYPTLWWLYRDSLLPNNISIVGYARSNLTMASLKENLLKNARPLDHFSFEGIDRLRLILNFRHSFCHLHPGEETKFDKFISRCSYIRGKYDECYGFIELQNFIKTIQQSCDGTPVNRLYYLALPPEVFEDVTLQISKTVWMTGVLGRVSSLKNLLVSIRIFRKIVFTSRTFVPGRPDLSYRSLSWIFNPSWNRDNIAAIVISFKENFGTQGRAGYFDTSGIIRDVMQNHLMQILTLVAMEKPASLDAEDIRDEKTKHHATSCLLDLWRKFILNDSTKALLLMFDGSVKVMKCIKAVKMEDVVLGQYVRDPKATSGEACYGYRDDKDVPQDSVTPTYALAVLKVNNERWDGVPFILRCGKALNESKAEVRIQFKEVSGDIYPEGQLKRAELVIRVQPNEAVYIKLMSKKPGMGFSVEETELDLTYGYKYKVIMGSQIDFVRTDELEQSWRIFTPLLKQIEKERAKPANYVFGSRGPVEADEMMIKHGFVFSGTYKWVPNTGR